ncbi:MAG: hypothetical protein ACREVO_21350 [Steroidobacteraceae bacterium]
MRKSSDGYQREPDTGPKGGPLPSIDESDDDALVEQCIEELDELVMALDRYPPAAVALAIGTYLEALLGALFDERLCTADEVRALLREIESGVLQPPHSAEK